MKTCGLHVTSIKVEPYINTDVETFSPYKHDIIFLDRLEVRNYLLDSGDMFVLDSSGEVDLDLGN